MAENKAETIPNVLAQRYASPQLKALWSERGRIVLERELWVAVLKAQRELGLDVSSEVITAYEQVIEHVDLDSINQRETLTRHDVKARIEEFCALAGHEEIHKGMTSRDLTDNVEQFQILRSLRLLLPKYVTVLWRLSQRSQQWRDLVVVARTHNVAAQPTTMGRRLAMFGEEMLVALRRLEALISSYPLRGLKGAVGTAVDQLTLCGGDETRLEALQNSVQRHLGFEHQLGTVGQIYPRSLDFEVVSCMFQLGSGVANLARTLRLMAGDELVTEGFAPGQVGSSAMPHKMNTRSCERINGLQVVLGGYLHMLQGLAGDQWFEGDVSCSVVRRVALPDSFMAFDGLIETAWHIIDDMGVYESVIDNEVQRYLPFLATTTLMMEAVQRGAGRENIHEAIKEHTVAVALEMREQGRIDNDLARRLGGDERVPFTEEEIGVILADSRAFTGLARQQVDAFVQRVDEIVRRHPEAREVEKSRLL